MFDVGQDRLQGYNALEKERLTNSILELYDFVLGSLLSAEMTQKQDVLFKFVTRLMMVIPDATIYTLRDLFEADDISGFAEHVAKLDGTARHFFEKEFADREFKQTKSQVRRRLLGVLQNRTFERMFAHPRSKLDIYSEMNKGKVILINTAKDLLKQSNTETFGRFFIALIAQAAQERAVLPENKRMPTMVYIDEAADYFDQNIETILVQAQKYKVGMVLAHQYLNQLSGNLAKAFSANTSIKFAGGVSIEDARTLSGMLNCEASLIQRQPKLSFAAHIRGKTDSAVTLKIPYGVMEAMPKMDAEQQTALKEKMRQKYSNHFSDVSINDVDDVNPEEKIELVDDEEAPNQKDSSPKRPEDPDRPDTGSSNDWWALTIRVKFLLSIQKRK